MADLVFVFPEEQYGKNPKVKIDFYKGAPHHKNDSLESQLAEGKIAPVQLDVEGGRIPMPKEAGLYHYLVKGEGFYKQLKVLWLSEEDLQKGKTLLVEGGKATGQGFEPNENPPLAPEGYQKDACDPYVMSESEEVLRHFGFPPMHYPTPAFDGKHAVHAVTTQDEMMAYIAECVAKNPLLHQYSCGTTEHYHFDLPLVLATATEIPATATLAEAAALVRKNGKPTVFQEAQIHANEVAAGEGALVMITNFATDKDTIALLDKINVVIVPRIHVESAYIFTRKTYDGFDPNRDHIALKAKEPEMVHAAWRLFEAEVVVDNHEFTGYAFNWEHQQFVSITDLEVSPSNNLNDDARVEKVAFEINEKIFDAAREEGIRAQHYGVSISPAVGRFYYGMYNCISFLVETRGIGTGRQNFERRVRSQELTTLTIMREVAERAEEIRDLVADARKKLIASGKTYDEKNLFVLHQSKSGNTKTSYGERLLTCAGDGTLVVKSEKALMDLNDKVERARPRPTAYLIPCDAPNADKMISLLDRHGMEHTLLAAGKTVTVQQYRYVGDFVEKEQVNGVIAELNAPEAVTFPKGAFVLPMDQLGATILASVCEPDVSDYHTHKGGTLAKQGLLLKDEKGNYPLYRYCGEKAREL